MTCNKVREWKTYKQLLEKRETYGLWDYFKIEEQFDRMRAIKKRMKDVRVF